MNIGVCNIENNVYFSNHKKMKLVTNHIVWRWLWWNPEDASWAMVGL